MAARTVTELDLWLMVAVAALAFVTAYARYRALKGNPDAFGRKEQDGTGETDD